jgi:outer membrane protein OmpA-like peptidoglycan-associated protein
MRLIDDIRVKALGRVAISKFCRSAAGKFCRCAAGFAVLGLPLWLAACSHVPDAINPVAWYRDVSGNSKSDVKDQQGRNQNNLAAGGDKAYPNLATVPDEPDRVLSGIDRDKLQESLVADRNNAKYSGDQLEAGRATSPGIASPAAAPQPQTQADAAPTPAQQSAMVPPGTADRSVQTSPVPAPAPLKPAAPAAQNRQNGSEQPPVESSLQTPEVRSVPQGETPPPPPQPANISQPPAASPAPVKSAAANPVQLTQPSAAERQIQTPPVERPAQSSLALRSPSGSGRAMSVSVGDITFATGSAALPAAHTGPLSDIAGLYKQSGGRIRVIGHAEETAGGGGDAVQRQVASLDLALDRANAVAQALAALGVPANAISVEAAPTHSGSELPRAEVFMEY